MRDAQAVIFRNKLFIGGADTPSVDGDYTICSYNSVADTWSTLDGPARLSAFTVYQAQLVLVGGELRTSDVTTNQVWVLGDESETWCQPLPAMPTARVTASAIAIDMHLIVIGWKEEQRHNLDIVEVYDGKQWAATDPLPIPCYCVKVAFHNDRYYLVGGFSQGKSVFSTSLQAIVSQLPRSEPVWKTHQNAPLSSSGVVVFESELVTVGGLVRTSLHMYSPVTDTWEVMESRLPEALDSMCSITLPTGEMMVTGGTNSNGDKSPRVYQASVKN